MRAIKFRACGGRYEVGDDGNVYSTDFNHTGERKALRTYDDKDGYQLVFLYVDGKRRITSVHRLVLNAFVPKPTPKHQVNHKNGDRADNRLENLEWLTSRENTLHGWARGRQQSEKSRRRASIFMSDLNEKRYAKAA